MSQLATIVATLLLVTLPASPIAAQTLGPPATTLQIGQGCSIAALQPVLQVSPPLVLGQVTAFNVVTSFSNITGTLWGSLGPSVVTPFPPYCSIFVDIPNAAPILNFAGEPGMWAQTLPVPNDPTLAGVVITFQVVFIDPVLGSAPQFTNGVEATLGY